MSATEGDVYIHCNRKKYLSRQNKQLGYPMILAGIFNLNQVQEEN